jgi:hypothetical protein
MNMQAELTDDFNLNDLPDAPSFTPWPVGSYPCALDSITFEDVDFGGNSVKCVVIKATLTGEPNEVKETIHPGEGEPLPIPAIGDSYTWNLSYEGNDDFLERLSKGQIKATLAPIANKVGSAQFSDIAAAAPGMAVTIITGCRKGKKDKADQIYSQLKVLAPAD